MGKQKIRRIKEINDSNDLLGYILNIQDNNGDFAANSIINFMGIQRKDDTEKYFSDLMNEGYIKRNGTDEFHVYPHAKKAYISPLKKMWLKIRPALMCFLGYIIGLISDDIKELFHALISIIIDWIKGA